MLVVVLQHYLAIKSLHSYTCYLISLQQAHMTAEEIVAHINVSELYGGLLASKDKISNYVPLMSIFVF